MHKEHAMKLLETRKVVKRGYEPGWDTYRDVEVKRPAKAGKVLIGLASLALAWVAVSDRLVDIAGDASTAKEVPAATVNANARAEAEAKYNKVFMQAPPAGKFALQYLTETKVVTRVRSIEPNNGNGLAGYLTGNFGSGGEHTHIRTVFNDGCLNKTAYDINGGDISGVITGLFANGEVSGEVPTAAANPYWDPEKPDELVIQSGHSKSRDLHFKGVTEGRQLVPADQQTKNVLATFGCEVGVRGAEEVNEYTLSSEWIK